MQVLLDVLIPVFLIVAFGYVSVWIRLFDNSLIEALVELTQNFAIPILLLKGMSLTVALFSLGGSLYCYRPEGDMRVILMIAIIPLVVYPALMWTFATALIWIRQVSDQPYLPVLWSQVLTRISLRICMGALVGLLLLQYLLLQVHRF